MGFECYLKIDGIPSQSSDENHKDWIEILSYSHGISQPGSGSVSSSGGRGTGRCDHQDFSVVKRLDKSSPKLALFCCNGTHIKKITMELCQAGGEQQKYMEYTLSDAIVGSVRPGGSEEGDEEVPLEEVSFKYDKIEWVFTETDKKTGKPKGDIKTHWDLTTNKGG